MIKYSKFDLHFDVARMQQEVDRLQTAFWKEHYNRNNYEGSWTTLQLRSVNGLIQNNTALQTTALQSSHAYQDTPLLSQCAYITEVIRFFEADKTAVRLMKLEPGAVIKTHRDHDLNFEQGEARIHIPVVTNPGVHFMLEEERILMEEGTCWYLNLSLPHCVRNEGTSERIHLVIDVVVNDWFQNFMNQPCHSITRLQDMPVKEMHSVEEKLKIIAELRRMQTDVGDQLADEMQVSLNKPG